jgi:hypothetical protein
MPIVALIGPPGTGKTVMACLTAPRKPVHVVDIDRKVRVTALLLDALKKGELTYKEISDTLAEDGLNQRMLAYLKDEKIARPPRGWSNIANYVGSMESDPKAKAAGTILWDSYTSGAMHMRSHIQYLTAKSKFQWDAWSTWKAMHEETTTTMIDYALTCQDCKKIHALDEQYDHANNDKDLIFTIHERVSEKPGDRSTGVRVTETPNVKTGVAMRSKEYLGTMDILIAGSIEGAFGLQFGTYFTDVYRLFIDMKGGVPTWRCRVLPDGLRDLRCSFNVKGVAEWDPDLAKIWGMK